MADVYGARPPWHDIQLAVRGPAVADVEATFRERWDDPAPLTRNPVNVVSERLRGDDHRPGPATRPAARSRSRAGRRTSSCCAPTATGIPGYPFARDGERSVAHGLQQGRVAGAQPDPRRGPVPVVGRDRRVLRRGAAQQPDPAPDRRDPAPPRPGRPLLDAAQPGRPPAGAWTSCTRPRRTASRSTASRTTPARRSTSTPRSASSTTCGPAVGSDNINRRSWTHDSELSCAVVDERARRARARRSSTGSATAPGASPATCAWNSPASTSTGPPTTTPTSSTRPACSARFADSAAAPAALARQRTPRPTATRAAAAVPGRAAVAAHARVVHPALPHDLRPGRPTSGAEVPPPLLNRPSRRRVWQVGRHGRCPGR